MSIYDLFSVRGKAALVTGGGRGLGYGIAKALVAGGARVAIASRSDRIFEIAEEMGAVALQVDLADREQARSLVERAIEALGGLDILVNNAGIQRRHLPQDFPLEDWDEVLAVNLEAVWILAQAAGRHMLDHGGGKIINVGSAQSFFGGTTIPAYAAAKGGVTQLTKALANDWAARGINVNAVIPGYLLTDMNAALIGNPEREPKILDRIPAGRWSVPDDFAGMTLFLSSAASDYVHGAILAVDGGYLGR